MSDPTARVERWLLLLTPTAALAVVALGLRVGAPSAVRAAVVYGAPATAAPAGLAWQVVVFEEDQRVRQPIPFLTLDVTAQSRDGTARARGVTNDDGVAELFLGLPSADGVSLEVRAGRALLARGEASPPPPSLVAPPLPAWARFARREGPIGLDVALLGQRAASGFPATVWVRASEGATGRPLTGVSIDAERDSSLSVESVDARTDSRGWARVVATPVGHSVALTLHARAGQTGPLGQTAQTGTWTGALFVSPGGAQLVARDRYTPDEEPILDVVVPNERSTIYIEVDDARGRAWADAIDLTRVAAENGRWPRARVRVPRLAPGLYWAITSGDAAGAPHLGPGTTARPFVVAATDEAGLSFGLDAVECAPRADGGNDAREAARALSACLALAAAPSVPRWTALDGFAMRRSNAAAARARGLSLALGALAIAAAFEALLLLRATRQTRSRLTEALAGLDSGSSRSGVGWAVRAWTVGLAVLVALLGLSLMAAFLAREG